MLATVPIIPPKTPNETPNVPESMTCLITAQQVNPIKIVVIHKIQKQNATLLENNNLYNPSRCIDCSILASSRNKLINAPSFRYAK